MANNLDSLPLGSWPTFHGPTFTNPSWQSPLFAHENEAFTNALRASISRPASSTTTTSSSTSSAEREPPAEFKKLGSPQPRFKLGPTAKVSKRKPRASRRTPTTYINADPANFRRMVQEVTGIQVGAAGLEAEPVVVVRPEPSRVNGVGPGILPTLDTSAFLFDRLGKAGSVGPVGEEPVRAEEEEEEPDFLFEPVVGTFFPTLESWGMI